MKSRKRAEVEKFVESQRLQLGLDENEARNLLQQTMSDADESRIAIQAATENTSLEVICTLTFSKTPANEYRTMMGISPAESVELLLSAGADIIGANCGNGTAGMIDIVKEIRSVNKEVPLLVHANAGLPVLHNGKTEFPESPGEMASQIKELVVAGANIVGGCCGTTPEHIRGFVKEIRGLPVSK